MDVVIGSGPSGLSAAAALLKNGRTVTMIDGGKALPSRAEARKAVLANHPLSSWTSADVQDWQAPQFSPTTDLVHRYGSDYAQEPLEGLIDGSPEWFAARSSLAVGGLSNVWGSSVLPNRQSDIEDWPISIEELNPHYDAITQIMPISGKEDGLASIFPIPSMANRHSLAAGPQGQKLLEKLSGQASELEAQHIYFGKARHAVQPGCNYCGMCLHGCPWDQIFSAADGLEDLKSNPNFKYRSGEIVQAFSEEADVVKLHIKDGSSVSANRVFIGAGVLETAKIVLSSMTRAAPVRLQDSRHFFLPFLHAWSADTDPATTPHHTLSEVFVEIDDPSISPYLTHTQIYGWNEFYAREMMANYGRLVPGGRRIFDALSRRLMVAQTFLHSDHCPEIELSLSDNKQTLHAELIEKTDTERIIKKASARLSKALRRAGLHALGLARRTGLPGSSFHSGGTFPMSSDPSQMQTDTFGRLHGSKRVHLIDASVLPSIPASTVTFSVMANAHRIGSTA